VKPATPLPWDRAPVYPDVYYGDPYVDMDDADAVYIVHAANAYPKLVAALRKYVESLEHPLHRLVLDGSEGRALLRELGEVS
jgi:hypothetical protein